MADRRTGNPALALLAASLLMAMFAHGASAEELCRRYRLPANFPRSLSAVQTGGGELLVAAYEVGELRRLGATAEDLGVVEGWAALGAGQVAAIREGAGGFIVQQGMDRLVWLDQALRVREVLDARRSRGGTTQVEGIASLYFSDLVEIPGGLVAFGFLARETERQNQRRVFSLRLDAGPTLATVVEELAWASPGTSLQNLVRPMLANAAGGTYFLRLPEGPALVQVAPEHRVLSAFPAGFDQLPAIPESRDRQDDSARRAAAERATWPAGIYSRGDHLFLLTRRARERGGTRWELHRVDPRSDRLLDRRELPTCAANLVLAPGPSRWLVLEQSATTAPGLPVESSLLAIAASWIEGTSSGNDDVLACP